MDLDPIRVETDAFGREYYLNEVTDYASFEPPAAATTNGWYFTHDARDVQCWANEDGREVRYDDPHYIPPTAEEIAAAWEQYEEWDDAADAEVPYWYNTLTEEQVWECPWPGDVPPLPAAPVAAVQAVEELLAAADERSAATRSPAKEEDDASLTSATLPEPTSVAAPAVEAAAETVVPEEASDDPTAALQAQLLKFSPKKRKKRRPRMSIYEAALRDDERVLEAHHEYGTDLFARSHRGGRWGNKTAPEICAHNGSLNALKLIASVAGGWWQPRPETPPPAATVVAPPVEDGEASTGPPGSSLSSSTSPPPRPPGSSSTASPPPRTPGSTASAPTTPRPTATADLLVISEDAERRAGAALGTPAIVVMAARGGHGSVLEYLSGLKGSTSMSVPNARGVTAFMAACSAGHMPVVEWLLPRIRLDEPVPGWQSRPGSRRSSRPGSRGSSRPGSRGSTPAGSPMRGRKLLLLEGDETSAADSDEGMDEEALELEAYLESLGLGHDDEEDDEDGASSVRTTRLPRVHMSRGTAAALALAAREGHINVVTFLHEKGLAYLDWTDSTGESLVYKAAAASGRTSKMPLLTYLIAEGADLTRPDDLGNTPLHASCAAGNLSACRALLNAEADRGVDADQLNARSESPFALAARHGHTEIVRFLLSAGHGKDVLQDAVLRDRTWRAVFEPPRRDKARRVIREKHKVVLVEKKERLGCELTFGKGWIEATEVTPGRPAAEAGVAEGDFVIALGDKRWTIEAGAPSHRKFKSLLRTADRPLLVVFASVDTIPDDDAFLAEAEASVRYPRTATPAPRREEPPPLPLIEPAAEETALVVVAPATDEPPPAEKRPPPPARRPTVLPRAAPVPPGKAGPKPAPPVKGRPAPPQKGRPAPPPAGRGGLPKLRPRPLGAVTE